MAFTNAVDQAFLDLFLTTYEADLWAGYSTADPGKDGATLAEPAGGGYARVDVSAGFTRAASEIDNDAEIVFTEASGDQGTITHACLFDGVTGDLIWSAELTTPKAVTTGDIPRFAAGELNLTAE